MRRYDRQRQNSTRRDKEGESRKAGKAEKQGKQKSRESTKSAMVSSSSLMTETASGDRSGRSLFEMRLLRKSRVEAMKKRGKADTA
jgi:anti-sigma28 factor (negative regulator of flagellin synthesis)